MMEKEEKKLFYDGAKLEIVSFLAKDIITTSPNSPFDDDENMDDSWTKQ